MTRMLNHMPASFLVLNNDKRKIYWLNQGSCPSLDFLHEINTNLSKMQDVCFNQTNYFYHLMNFNRWKLHWCNYKSPVAFDYHRQTHPIWNYIPPAKNVCIMLGLTLSALLLSVCRCICYQAIIFVLSDEYFWNVNNMITNTE